MPSTDVTLDRDRTPVFPARCVACGLPDPADTMRVTDTSGGWLFGLFAIRHTVDVPVCGPCRPGLVFQRRWRSLLLWAAIVVGAVVGFAVLPLLGLPANRWTVLGVVVLFIIPFAVWIVVAPPAFDITVHQHTVEYEFRDPEYAAEFDKLNAPPADE